jgi:DsbC/DsbD-like thiol-disulfide interchange protein
MLSVTPAKAGVQRLSSLPKTLDSGSAEGRPVPSLSRDRNDRTLRQSARGTFTALLFAAALPATAAPLEIVSIGPVATVTLKAGASAVAIVPVTVKPGFHVQANPVLNEFLIPIVLTVPATAAVTTQAPKYPAPKRMRLGGSDEDLVIYDGTFAIRLPLSAAPGATGETSLKGTLRYQACDDSHCFPPKTLPVHLIVRAADRGPTLKTGKR